MSDKRALKAIASRFSDLDDLADFACQLQDMAQDIEEHIHADDIVRASDCARQASVLLSRIMVGLVDLTIQRLHG